MKGKLQLMIALGFCFLAVSQISSAQTVTVNAGATWNGYANIFDLSNNYQFGSAWGVADLKTVIDVNANTLTLYPNYNTYNPTDAYWANGAIGNKIFEANTYVENTALAGNTVTFNGFCSSNTISSAYQNFAFIKALDPANGYATVVSVTAPLVTGQNFTITAPSIPTGLIVQYGFTIKGLNANPATQATSLGNVVVGPMQLSSDSFNKSNEFNLYPNPTSNKLTIESLQDIQSIAIYNVVGQEVKTISPLCSVYSIDVSSLENGLYILKAESNGATTSKRFIKN
jgi:hypothetical protein